MSLATAFPQSTSLLAPYPDNGHLTCRQKNFNTTLSKRRVVVENAFSLLKVKFRRIKTLLDVTNTSRASSITVAACVLHNIYVAEKDWRWDEVDNDAQHIDDAPICEGGYHVNHKRDAIADYLPIII